jgi:hypothetical protein
MTTSPCRFLLPMFSLAWAFILISLTGYDENRIRFEAAQPQGVRADLSIRKDFQGVYFSEQDSVYLLVGFRKISLQFNKEFSLESFPELNANLSLGSDSSDSFRVKVQTKPGGPSDSVQLETSFEEVLLDLSAGHEARYFRGYYFLNVPSDGGGFKVSYLIKNKHNIQLHRIENDSLLQELKDSPYIRKTQKEGETEGEHWELNPSRKELKELIRKGLFSGQIEFQPISRVHRGPSRP